MTDVVEKLNHMSTWEKICRKTFGNYLTFNVLQIVRVVFDSSVINFTITKHRILININKQVNYLYTHSATWVLNGSRFCIIDAYFPKIIQRTSRRPRACNVRHTFSTVQISTKYILLGYNDVTFSSKFCVQIILFDALNILM